MDAIASKAEVRDIEAALDALLDEYRRAVWKAYQLPFFSLTPFFILTWQSLLMGVGLYVDILLAPYNLLALLMRRFGKKWPIITPFFKRLRYVALYLHRGEWIGAIAMRPIVRWLVKSHIARRLRSLGELVATSEEIPFETRTRLLEKVSAAQARHPVRELQEFAKDSLIPALVLGGISIATKMVADEGEKRALEIALYSILGVIGFYFISIIVAGFPTKRGLFLGRDPRHAPFPGGVRGQGIYGLERSIFAHFPVRPKEMSLDLSFLVLSTVVGLVFSSIGLMSAVTSGINAMGGGVQRDEVSSFLVSMATLAAPAAINTPLVLVAIYVRVRRGMLKRN